MKTIIGKTVAEVLRYFCEYVIVFTDGTGVYIGAPDHDEFDTAILSPAAVVRFRLKAGNCDEPDRVDPDGQMI